MFITRNGSPISFLSPEFVLNKFYPKYNYLDIYQIQNLKFDPSRETRIKVTRVSEYGERYKLFLIKKNTFENEFNLEDNVFFHRLIC